MTDASKNNRKKTETASRLDATDRKLLSLLGEDSTMSYAAMGRVLHLSAPAVHERAKRLKQEAVIKGNVAIIDGSKVGRPLLAFVHADTKSWNVTRQLQRLKELPAVEEIHTVSGESGLLLKVRTSNTQVLVDLLQAIQGIEGISGIRSYVALCTHLERGPSPLES